MNDIDGYYSKLLDDDEELRLFLDFKAVSKERPRTGKSGHVYTPQRTRAFEREVAKAAKDAGFRPFHCPVSVTITISDPIPKSYKGRKLLAAQHGYINPPVGDLDNKVKAITDALNGIAYIDDKQVNLLRSHRRYWHRHGIDIAIRRNGLSLLEVLEGPWQDND